MQKIKRIVYATAAQKSESATETHAAKAKLAKRESQNGRFCCLEPEMPYTTAKVELCDMDITVSSAVAKSAGQTWDGRGLAGKRIASDISCELLVMLRELDTVLAGTKMPRIVVALQFKNTHKCVVPWPCRTPFQSQDADTRLSAIQAGAT